MNKKLGLVLAAGACIALVSTLAVTCMERVGGPESDSSLAREGATTMGSPGARGHQQAHLWLSIRATGQSTGGESDAEPVGYERRLTTSPTFDVTITNRGLSAVNDVVLLVAVSEVHSVQSGWAINLGGTFLVDEFVELIGVDPLDVGFGRGSHGVYPPSGDARYAAYARGTQPLAPDETWVIRVVVDPGEIEGFLVHFDAGSDLYFSPNDVDARPESRPASVPPDGGEDPSGGDGEE